MDSTIITIVIAGVDLILVGLAIALIFDRLGTAMARANAANSQEDARRHTAEMEAERLATAIEEQKKAITGKERTIAKLRAEIAQLEREFDRIDTDFVYTPVPVEGSDASQPAWRFRVRHPRLGDGVAPPQPASAWETGRMYVAAATNQNEARSILERALPRNRGFDIVTLGPLNEKDAASAPKTG